MAVSAPRNERIPCRYFLSGTCHASDRCPFLHSPSSLAESKTAPPESSKCKFYTLGTCFRGQACPFEHASPSSSSFPHPPIQLSREGDVDFVSHFQTLTLAPSKSKSLKSWADAPEFVPRQAAVVTTGSYDPNTSEQDHFYQQQYDPSHSYHEPAPSAEFYCQNPTAFPSISEGNRVRTWADVASPHGPDAVFSRAPQDVSTMTVDDAESNLCPFGVNGECRYGDFCSYIHGDICDLCGKAVLHPDHKIQRKNHQKICMKEHEEDMELAFAVAKSKNKTCGICMEVIIEKEVKGEARFGILPNCTHCFCLTCLRQWRQSKFEHKIIRSCPECRQTSDYICPSKYWVDTKEEKEKLLEGYKSALNSKECKYYKRGEGECPFGNKCFYQHVDSSGKMVDVGPPQRRPRRSNANGELTLVDRLLFFDFLAERDGRTLEFLDILELLSDNDSEYEFMFGNDD